MEKNKKIGFAILGSIILILTIMIAYGLFSSHDFYYADLTSYRYDLSSQGNANLTSYYKSDINSSYNDSFSNNHGTINGGALFTNNGAINGGYYFDGNNDYISYSTTFISNGGTDFTACMYVNSSDMTDTASIYWSEGNTATNAQHTSLGQIGADIRAYIRDDASSSLATYYDSTLLNSNQTYFMCTVYNGADTISLYIDGVLANSTTGSSLSTLTINVGAIGVLDYNSAPTGYFTGIIDEVSLWNDDLTAAKIADLYNQTTNRTIIVSDVDSSNLSINTSMSSVTIKYDTTVVKSLNDTLLGNGLLQNTCYEIQAGQTEVNWTGIFEIDYSALSTYTHILNYTFSPTACNGITITNHLLGEITYSDLTADGTNVGRTSEGWTPSELTQKNITPINTANNAYFVMDRTDGDCSFNISIGATTTNSPSPSGSNTNWLTYLTEIPSSDITSTTSINIEHVSGTGTCYIDYIGLIDKSNASLISNSSWVALFTNITAISADLDLKKGVTYLQNGSQLSTANLKDVSSNPHTWGDYLYIYQIPNSYDENFSINSYSNSTNVSSGALQYGSNYSVSIDGTSPVQNSITTALNALVNRAETITLNVTEINDGYNEINCDSGCTSFNLTEQSANIWNGSIIYTSNGTHTIISKSYDLVDHLTTFSFNVKTSSITSSNSTVGFSLPYNYTTFVNVTDAVKQVDQTMKQTITYNASGTAYINDYNYTHTILNVTYPTGINITLSNSSVLTKSNNDTTPYWVTDAFNNTATNSLLFSNILRYSIDKGLYVEWENSGVGDTRLFYVKSQNTTLSLKNITLQIPLRSTYSGNSSSIDVFECTSGINWGAKTCSQWTERTSAVFSQSTLTYHHWGNSTTQYPTIDNDGDGNKDAFRITIPSLSEKMWRIDLDSVNAETSWSAEGGSEPSTPSSGGGGGGGSSTTATPTTVALPSTVATTEVGFLGSIVSSISSFFGNFFGGVSKLIDNLFGVLTTGLDFGDSFLIMMVLFVLILAFLFLSGGTQKTKQKNKFDF